MKRKAIFIGATGQNVGKTTICLGLIASFLKKIPNLGFMKPVGQEHKKIENGHLVDKDVILFKEYFHLPHSYEEMSPVIFHPDFTRDFLDGKIDLKPLEQKIVSSFKNIESHSEFTIVEGTGHIGVGSLCNLNNAFVANMLGLDLVIIAKGGIGSAFDELALNIALCQQWGVKCVGVILNRVLDTKREMVEEYMSKALKRWDIPLMGSLPFNAFLNTPSMNDFELLFKTKLFSGEKYHYAHFETTRLVATSVERFKEVVAPNQLIVTPATREDIVGALIEKNREPKPQYGLILTGRPEPSSKVIEMLKRSDIPALYAAESTYDAMKLITSFTAKIVRSDLRKVEKAIQLVEKHIDPTGLYR